MRRWECEQTSPILTDFFFSSASCRCCRPTPWSAWPAFLMFWQTSWHACAPRRWCHSRVQHNKATSASRPPFKVRLSRGWSQPAEILQPSSADWNLKLRRFKWRPLMVRFTFSRMPPSDEVAMNPNLPKARCCGLVVCVIVAPKAPHGIVRA